MAALTLHLEPYPQSMYPPVDFTFDPDTQEFGGPDGKHVQSFVEDMQSGGYAYPIPHAPWPLGDRLSLMDMTAIIATAQWLVPDELPPLPDGWWDAPDEDDDFGDAPNLEMDY